MPFVKVFLSDSFLPVPETCARCASLRDLEIFLCRTKKMHCLVVLLCVCLACCVCALHVYKYVNKRTSLFSGRKIPRCIYLTYKTKDSIPKDVIQTLEQMNPGYSINVYGDDECYHFLKTYFSQEYADFFQTKIEHGPIKADFWRACVIYVFGGVYLDADVRLEKPLDNIIAKHVTFCTSGSSKRKDHVNPIILGATPKSPVIKDCIEYMYELRNRDYDYWTYSICKHLARSVSEHIPLYAHNKSGFFDMQDGFQAQMFSEHPYQSVEEAATFWYGDKILNNHNPKSYDNRSHAFA